MNEEKFPIKKIKRLKIGRSRFDFLHTLPKTGIVGFADFDHKTLHVSPDQIPEEYLETLLHEILHAVWRGRGLPNRVTEEKAVTRLAHGLTEILLENVKFADYLEYLVHVSHGKTEEIQ
jgi:hypothetical protein